MTAKPNIINRLVERTQDDPSFFGSIIKHYLKTHAETKQQLASRLSCSTIQLDRLSICLLPKEEDKEFLKKIQKVAQYVGVKQDILLNIVREVQALNALRQVSDTEIPQMLKAARDKKANLDDL
jgi:hypothetical protein